MNCKENKAFRERQQPQSLDQWMNSPFIARQVGNCKSFTLTHYLADLYAMHRDPRSIPLCIQHHIQLTSLPFQVSRPSHSWVTAVSIFYLENPRSRSWMRSKFEFKMWVRRSIDSHPFRSMAISCPITEIRLFQNLTLKIQGQGHGRGEHWKSHHGSNILSTHIPFVPCQSALSLKRYDFFKIWPWKSKVKVKSEGEYWKSQHSIDPRSFHSMSIGHPIPDTTFSKFDLENPTSRSWLGSKLKVTKWV